MAYGFFFMKILKVFILSIFCVLLTACSVTLERRNVKIQLESETEQEIVFNGSCFESTKVVNNIEVLYPNQETAIVLATATSANFMDKNASDNFVICIKNNPKLRFVLFGTKKHIIWIRNK